LGWDERQGRRRRIRLSRRPSGEAIVAAEPEQDTRDLHIDDPAIKSGLHTFDVYLMPNAVFRPRA
jgi:hypothetical protein